MTTSAARIEDYALVGDCETAALVSRTGAIDWLCWPRFDSQACFAALLGNGDNGRWSLAPTVSSHCRDRRYRDDTLILETHIEAECGSATLIDFMPIRGVASDVVRIVVGRRGKVPMRSELQLRFDYGRLVPWIERVSETGLRAIAGPHSAVVRTSVPLTARNGTIVSDFTVAAGQRVAFVLSYQASHLSLPKPVDAEAALDQTQSYWRDWVEKSCYSGAWAEAVKRSLIAIKAMTYQPTGGIVAAPTTSLPELMGGTRNWDYRFCWLRDATFMIACLLKSGYHEEAIAWRNWLLRAIAGMPSQIQPIYGITAEHRLDEFEVPWLSGFGGSRPVRVGNAAVNQFQLDVYGELINAMHLVRHAKLPSNQTHWQLQKLLLENLSKVWAQPDEGIWEVRGGRQLFTHSKVMAWVAADRAVKAVEEFGLDGPVREWRALRDMIHAEVCSRGFDAERGAFVQAFGSKHLDASALLIPIVGFLPPHDPRVQSTVAAIEQELTDDGLVLRYDSEKTKDGLPPGEGVFLVCSFWLAENYALQGRYEDAHALFERLLSLRNDVGLLAEEYDTRERRLLGNFPQALSHLALVNTAHRLSVQRSSKRGSLNP